MGRRVKREFGTYKQRGEWVELLFMMLAAGRGFNVAKPWGDSARYDVTLEREGRFLRVQIKSTDNWTGSGYLCPLHGFGQRLYKAGEIDYFAVYVVPEDIWYIFPEKRLRGQASVYVSPRRKGHKYERYKDAWWLLQRHHERRGARTFEPREKKSTLNSMSRLSRRIVERLR